MFPIYISSLIRDGNWTVTRGHGPLSLMAARVWRLLNDPTSLIARIYKGRYYSSKDFMESGKGYKPSYAWRSISFGKELLKKGLYKSMGNGENTYICSDNWILDPLPRRPVNKERTIDVNRKVSSLIDHNGSWNREALHSLFPENEVKRILKILHGCVADKVIGSYRSWIIHGQMWLLASGKHREERLPQSQRTRTTSHSGKEEDLESQDSAQDMHVSVESGFRRPGSG